MFSSRERRLPIDRQCLNALGKLDADVNKLAEISLTSLSVSRHIRLLLGFALLSQALGLSTGAADLLLTPNFSQYSDALLCPPLALSK
jgi:hypothetical protein